MMKGVKEANKLKGQLEKLKKMQEIQRMKIEVERKKREGIPLDGTEQVKINTHYVTRAIILFTSPIILIMNIGFYEIFITLCPILDGITHLLQ